MRGETSYHEDECIKCEIGTYSLDPARFSPEEGEPFLVAAYAGEALALCHPCPEGGTCKGGNDVMNAENYWRNDFPQRSSRRQEKKKKKDKEGGADGENGEDEESSLYANMTLLRVFPCQPGYCLENGTCLNGSTGVLCSMCLPNHAMSGGSCDSCESDVDMDQVRAITMVVFVFGFLLIWLILCAKSLMPMVQGALAKVTGIFAARASGATRNLGGASEKNEMMADAMDCMSSLKETVEDSLPSDLTDGGGGAMFKIVISFYQVVSSFLNFNIKWPPFITNIFLMSEQVNIQILTLPGLSCILMGTSYQVKLIAYTIGPILLYVAIMLPCAFANVFFSQKTLSESPWKPRYDAAKRSMMNNICFFSFLIYPAVSLTVLKGLQCRDFGPPVGALIVSDVSIVCPYGRQDGSTFLFLYTLVFVFVYPIGLPFFLYLILRAYRLPEMVTRKILQSGLSVMIQMYMDETCDVCLKRLAGILWSEPKIETWFYGVCNDDKHILLEELQNPQPGDRNSKFKQLLLGM